MQLGLYLPNFGDHAEPGRLVALARAAEDAGWDGLFLWDHVQRGGRRGSRGTPLVDPWIALSAIAVATDRIRLGPLVTPLARRRPWVVARQAVTLDHLSGGRLVLGVGLGAPPEAEFSAFGETPDPRLRAQKLDEALAILDGLWSGKPFSYKGLHYELSDVVFQPTPVQQPRIPIWVAGVWPGPRPFERAWRWDGVFPLQRRAPAVSADQLEEIRDFVRAGRKSDAHFDLVAGGDLPGETSVQKRERAAAARSTGATWWLEWAGVDGARFEETLSQVKAGPPGF